MNTPLVQARTGITIVGGGPVSRPQLTRALSRAPVLVAADGGADRLLALGHEPQVVIGDMDSISDPARARLADRLHPLPEQATTDFDKTLRSVSSPFVLALGFAGGRMDHGLAVMHGLVARPEVAAIVLGPKDLAFHAPPGRALRLRLRPGEPLSLFPMAPVTGESEGLEWPISGLNFSPAGQIGTSNRVTAPEVRLRFDGAGMLVILPLRRLDAAISALAPIRPE